MLRRGVRWGLDQAARGLEYIQRAQRERAERHIRFAARQTLMQEQAVQGALAQEWEALQGALRARMPNNAACYGYKVYSQADEDGILAEILARIPRRSRTFIEIGCGDGRENNTTYLLMQGYRGCWCDASATNIKYIESELGGLSFPRLLVEQHFVDRESTKTLMERWTEFLREPEPDVLSVDIDGNDVAVTQAALIVRRPKVLCVEYNANFPPPLAVEMAYDASFRWQADDYQGASLQAWCDSLPDYRLVACSLSGVNAFFVRRDLAGPFTEYPIADLYQPPRHRFIVMRPGHAPSLKWVRQIVAG